MLTVMQTLESQLAGRIEAKRRADQVVENLMAAVAAFERRLEVSEASAAARVATDGGPDEAALQDLRSDVVSLTRLVSFQSARIGVLEAALKAAGVSVPESDATGLEAAP